MKKLVFAIFYILTGLSAILATRTVSTYLDNNDLNRLQKVFADGLQSNDLQSIYYSTLNIEVTNPKEKELLCKKIVEAHTDSKLNNFEKDFYLIAANKNLHCAEKIPESILSKVYAAFKNDVGTIQEVYFRFISHKLLGVQVDEDAIKKIALKLQEVLKKEDTLINLGYSFNLAAEMGEAASFVAKRVEDAIAQADEVDGKMLQFEGGLSITALVINGAISVDKVNNKPIPMSALQAEKFANYFLSRRSVQTPKGAHVLIEALKSLNSVKDITPLCIKIFGNKQLPSNSPELSIAVVDLLGKPVSPVPKNIYGKVMLKKDRSLLAEKVEFVAKSSDKTIFSANLLRYKPVRGIYTIDITAENTYTQQYTFKILGRAKVESLEISVAETSAVSTIKKYNANYPNTLSEKLSADATQKFSLKAIIIDDDTNKPLTVHQSFVRLLNKITGEEVIFIADQDSSRAYKVDIDIGTRAGDFNFKSGEYEISLIIGDAFLSNSLQWHIANIDLQFQQDHKDAKKQAIRTALPEIIHQFRVPEKRPPRFVSDIFTGLCLTPLVLLFILWGKLGINISNFNLAPSTIGFHLGFGSILTLFAVFWWKLNMFQTLRLLIPIAIVTFLSGNRLLRRIYSQRVSKQSSGAALS
ncbi:dolichyl-diphosphooligosaccharide--protein glycosyltransferase subunit 2-like [Teleopsis dalmanni]|uniref:dolichyl-diphosphooligosaccharide--protein glycosyltransferase subunit 2-like n=1 Tax=Teleopsis dalmanni TaxID=139649 RepID=UPI0018CD0461|nr:dolichyl-diphosphooligosaccharide--protein glycosyltransferase subunit 2-like [Teleopsis dalmanni]